MKAMQSPRARGALVLRELRSHALAVALLLGTLALVTTASIMATRAARRYREFSTRALTEFAAMGAWNFSIRAFSGLENIAAQYSRIDGLASPLHGPDITRISNAVDSLEHCRCGAFIAAWGYATGKWGDTNSVIYRPTIEPQDHSSDREMTTKLTAIRRVAARAKGAEWPLVVRYGERSPSPWMLLIVPLAPAPNAPAGFFVIDVRVEDWRDRILHNLHAERSSILPLSLVGFEQNKDIARFRVYSRLHGAVFERPTRERSDIEASVPLDHDSTLFVGIALSRAVTERIVRGAMPRTNLALEVALPFFAVLLVLAIALTVLRAERLARARTRFAASVSHELRTPLTHILLNAETLHYGRERDAADRESTAGVIAREARRLVYLVENVLQFSKAEYDVLRLHPRSVRIDLLVAELADNWCALVEDAGATLDVTAHHAVWALADPAGLQLVLTNLLDNALHYAPGSAIRVIVEGHRHDATISVDDEGPGIPVDERARLVQPFHRSRTASTQHPTGAGIGLGVVVQLMTAMNGTMHMENVPSRGLRVTLRLPIAIAALREVVT